MTRRHLLAKIKALKTKIDNSKSTCPMDYVDWNRELRALKAKLKRLT